MTVRQMSQIAILATLLFIIYNAGSQLAYVELLNFTILIYGVTLPRKDSFLAVFIFSCLIILMYGIQPWALMYIIVFPLYTQLYYVIGKWVQSEFKLALVGFIFAFLCGTLIDLPYILMSGMTINALKLYVIMGFKVSLGNALCTFLATLYLYQPLSKQLKHLVRRASV